MLDDKYSLRYIPMFINDLGEIVDYISIILHNSESAMKLVKKIENAIDERSHCPLAFEPFQSNRNRKYPYYRIYVDNFTIYYVVIENFMEMRRILYNRRDACKIRQQ